MCIVRWSITSPTICYGLVKKENEKGYYYDGSDWVQDDAYVDRVFFNYRYEDDWMDIGDADGLSAEEELIAAKASIRRSKERAAKGADITADDVRAETDRYGMGTLKFLEEDDIYKYYVPVVDIGMEDVGPYHYPRIIKASKKSGDIYFLLYYDVCKLLKIKEKTHTGEMKRFWLADYTAADDGSILECSKYVRVEAFDDGEDCFEYEVDGWRYMLGYNMNSYAGLIFIGDDHLDLFKARQRTLGLIDDSSNGIKCHTNIGPLGSGNVDLETGRPRASTDVGVRCR